MQPKDKTFAKKHAPAPAQVMNTDYIPFITERLMSSKIVAMPAFVALDDAEWRQKCEYSAAAEDFLIRQSSVFMRIHSTGNYTWQNRRFLQKLSNKIAVFLAEYTMKSGKYETMDDAVRAGRDKLFRLNPYVAKVTAGAKKPRNNSCIVLGSHKKKKGKDQISRDVDALFDEAATYRRHRHTRVR